MHRMRMMIPLAEGPVHHVFFADSSSMCLCAWPCLADRIGIGVYRQTAHQNALALVCGMHRICCQCTGRQPIRARWPLCVKIPLECCLWPALPAAHASTYNRFD